MKTDNEIIMEFMGVTEQQGFYDSYNQDEPYWFTSNYIFRTDSRSLPDISYQDFIENSRYHASFDWLMPVVEKISKIHDSKFKYDVSEIKQGNWPADNEYMDVIALPLATPISEAYAAVVKFIKYYNDSVLIEREKDMKT